MADGTKRPAPYSIRLDEQLRHDIEANAARENRTLANMIDTLLREALAARERRDGTKMDRRR